MMYRNRKVRCKAIIDQINGISQSEIDDSTYNISVEQFREKMKFKPTVRDGKIILKVEENE